MRVRAALSTISILASGVGLGERASIWRVGQCTRGDPESDVKLSRFKQYIRSVDPYGLVMGSDEHVK